ncbi:MAG: MarR family winged helix-turn-helix transcriptional regulator [Steroidobacteraceae bacterium]
MVTRALSNTPSGSSLAEIYHAETFKPRESLAALLGRARDAMTTAVDQGLTADPQLAPFELSWPQLKIFAHLATDGEPKSAAGLCKSMTYDAGAMTRMVDRLENKGLIRRMPCPRDRRLVYLELTEEGQAIWPQMKEVLRKTLNALMRGFSPAEARQLEGLLRRIPESG